MLSIVFGVAHKEDPASSVPSSDSRSFKIKHEDVIAFTLQILDPLPGGNADDSRYVLTDDAMRPKLPDNAEHFRPQKPLVFLPTLLSGHGKRLAGESGEQQVVIGNFRGIDLCYISCDFIL